MRSVPQVSGHIDVETDGKRVCLAGDPEGLRSVARILHWLADVDQSQIKGMPEGEREHVHLNPGFALSLNSVEIELCRLDAKGTGEFPANYEPIKDAGRSAGVPEWRYRRK